MDTRVLLVAPRAGRLISQEIQLANRDFSHLNLNSPKYKRATVIRYTRTTPTTHRGPRHSTDSPPKRKKTPTNQPTTISVPSRTRSPRAESRARHPIRAHQHRLERTSTTVLLEAARKATSGFKDTPNRHHHYR
ncbi:hypothetical protein MTO96_049724 [Rhipicephalus appendiculatus]